MKRRDNLKTSPAILERTDERDLWIVPRCRSVAADISTAAPPGRAIPSATLATGAHIAVGATRITNTIPSNSQGRSQAEAEIRGPVLRSEAVGNQDRNRSQQKVKGHVQ